jgi:hypothetical protein
LIIFSEWLYKRPKPFSMSNARRLVSCKKLTPMNYPAASSGVSPRALNAPKGDEFNPKELNFLIKNASNHTFLRHRKGQGFH